MYADQILSPKTTLDRDEYLTQYKEELPCFYRAALACALPIALWRDSNRDQIYGVVSLSEETVSGSVDLNERKPAFLFSPFNQSHEHQSHQIVADLVWSQGVFRREGMAWSTQQQKNFERFLWATQGVSMGLVPGPTAWYSSPYQIDRMSYLDRQQFCRLVSQARDVIRRSDIDKIVVSRVTDTPLSSDFDPVILFSELCAHYPHAFVSLVAIPGVGTWIGASPELLLSLTNNQLQTVALAGTKARPQNQPISAVQWGVKELEEQGFVANDIRTFFQRVNYDSLLFDSEQLDSEQGIVREEGPKTVAAGNVVHLRTDYSITLDTHKLHTVANRMLNELHPTSAVCGMPKDKAVDFIHAKEGYDRRFYSGYLGPVHIDGQSSLYVNLRCMELEVMRAKLYVGVGITADSEPDAEWRETKMKADTLLNVMNNKQ
ncbi:chorismate-binding protein [Chloroflexi bacterium TSY]|nr:chorismate-binding protein [Chloroflexi bacterium TSY]